MSNLPIFIPENRHVESAFIIEMTISSQLNSILLWGCSERTTKMDLPSITEFYDERCVFITGATGFMGKVASIWSSSCQPNLDFLCNNHYSKLSRGIFFPFGEMITPSAITWCTEFIFNNYIEVSFRNNMRFISFTGPPGKAFKMLFWIRKSIRLNKTERQSMRRNPNQEFAQQQGIFKTRNSFFLPTM